MVINIFSTNHHEILECIREILTEHISVYPNILDWYDNTVVPSLTPLGNGCIFVAMNKDDIAGYIILKNTEIEKKIRHIMVLPQYRRNHIGSRLILKAFEYLGTRTPKITVSEDNINGLQPLLDKYKFELTDIVKDIYIKGKDEYIFNGE